MHIIVAQGYRRLLFCLGLFLTLVACESGSSSNPGSDSTVSSVRVDKQSTKLPAGVTQQLSVQAVFSDGTASDVTRQVKWAVEPLGIVDIDGQGRLLAKEVGTVNITATFVDTTSDSIAIEVSDATITGLALTPKVHHMTVNATNHHVAAALFSDESAHDVTLSPHTQYHVS
ncbi:MAG: hypothetical protein GY814_00950, partial [Gammaproteobacteria bacterium]|nr:hypothetical protein [Gammaproteobacteria bacterium]